MDAALELAQIINSGPEFSRRINDYTKAAKDARDAAEKHDIAKANAERAQGDLERKLAEHRAAMAEATKKSDAAAAEAAKRIELANGLKAENDKRAADLDRRDRELGEREKVVELLKDQFKRAIDAVGNL